MPDGREPLLEKVMENGKILRPHPSLQSIRERFADGYAGLDEKYKPLQTDAVYPVEISDRLQAIQPAEDAYIPRPGFFKGEQA